MVEGVSNSICNSMKTKNIDEVVFWKNNHENLILEDVDLNECKNSDGDLVELRIYFLVSNGQLWNGIDEKWLKFHRNNSIKKTLIHSLPVQIDAVLKPDLLSEIISQIKNSDKEFSLSNGISNFVKNVFENHRDLSLSKAHPLLVFENWYCTAIRQEQPSGLVEYKTLWHYLLPILQNPDEATLSNSITQYIQDQTADSLNQITAATDPLFKDIAETFQSLFTDILAGLEEEDDEPEEESPASLWAVVADFLEAEEWPYVKLPATAETTATQTTRLRLAFKGENGQWFCYITLNPEQQTLCFYSNSPASAQSEQCPAIAEFIARANYGMILGNFELDYSDGEIRYKTSIDVEGDRLTAALLQNLVYTNVMTMDQYLPGILAILEQNATPAQAIQLVEDTNS